MASALKRLYWKISWDCRQFAAGRGLPREVLPAYLFLVQRYWLKFGRLRWFLRPKTYNELLHRKMLRLRDPLLQLSTEKVNARDYVAAKAGRDCLIPLHYVGADVDAIPFADLPAQYVIKASHGSGFNIIVGDKTTLDESAVKAQLRRWLDLDWYRLSCEWGYKGIPRRIMVEALLLERGQLPANYRLFVFNGKVSFIGYKPPGPLAPTIVNRPPQATTDYFDTDWRPLLIRDDKPGSAVVPAAPKNLPEMLRLAELLAADFESCCIDLYNVDGKIYFGEVTHYCASGLARFSPDFDAALGQIWREGGPIPERFYRPVKPIDGAGEAAARSGSHDQGGA